MASRKTITLDDIANEDVGEHFSSKGIEASVKHAVKLTGEPVPDGESTDSEDKAFSWDQLDQPFEAPDKSKNDQRRVNVLTEIPAPIRQRAESSLAINTARVRMAAQSAAARNRVDYHWDIQPVPTAKIGEEFAAKLVRYAKYRPANTVIEFRFDGTADGQVTARTGALTWYAKNSDGTYDVTAEGAEGAFLGVRYSVRPFEQRKSTARLPGTA